MKSAKRIVGNFYWVALIILVTYGIFIKIFQDMDWIYVFHALAYYLPAIAILSVISGQIDLLESIQAGGEVNLKARIYDFVHWLMLIGINIGAWMIGGVTIWWFILKLLLLGVIGWQIGAGLKRRLKLFVSEKIAGFISTVAAFIFGGFAGYIRSIDDSPFGWGWMLEGATAVIATLIVVKWIYHDLQIIKQKAIGYPRTFFVKGIFCNFLVIWFWLHIMTEGSFNSIWWIRNLGLSFNVLVGNLIFLIYWLTYEYHRKKQEEVAK